MTMRSRGRSIEKMKIWCTVVLLLQIVTAECPNGCSGTGDCMAKDMCMCYKNYEGNDCAERTCLYGTAHVDTPKGDINMDQTRLTPNWILTDSQRQPYGTYEFFHPAAVTNEAHFYMECSNKGICDRTTGLCECFDGYEGNGCQRTTCPNKCSDHGTCESLRELGVKTGGTLFGREAPAGAVTYNLWDANSTYGCRCDPWFFAPDCSKRNCKVGVDPLYRSVGTPSLETFVIHAYLSDGNAATVPANSWIRLRVFDYYGESYITAPIPIQAVADTTAAATIAAAQVTNAAAVETAILGIPNLTFRDITCEPVGAGTELGEIKSAQVGTKVAGMSVACQYVDNPGKMRIPEVAAYSFPGATITKNVFVVTTSQQGHDDDWFTTDSGLIAVALDGADHVSLSVTGTAAALTAAITGSTLTPQLIKFGPYIVAVTGKTPSAADPATIALPHKITLQYPSVMTPAGETVFIQTSPSIATTAPTASHMSVAINVGDDFLTFGADPTTELPPGTQIFYQNALYWTQQIWTNAAGTVWYVRIDKPFGGDALAGAAGGPYDATGDVTDVLLKVTHPSDKTKRYNYVSECSGRGMCGYDTGICTCFKGYTNDNCNTQNILAL